MGGRPAEERADRTGGGEDGPSSSGRDAPRKPDPLIGRVINDRFRIVGLVARGGMGKVYRAEQAPLGREVALKVLDPRYSGDGDPEFHRRFFLEASTCSKLGHPNTVTIFDYGRTDDDVFYIAMELLAGRTLHRALREDGPFAPERAMHVARQVCRSLREAHQHGVIHRDLKPANVFLMKHGDESDFVKVLDFGLVKDLEAPGEDLTQTGLFMGSPKYMAPEQIRGEKVDGRADVYALGVILYEMLTGKVPFDRPNSVNILMAHVHEAPPPLAEANPDVQVPPGLARVVERALAKQPRDRFRSMDEMLVALKDLAAEAGLAVTHSGELGLSGQRGLESGPFPASDATVPSGAVPMTPSSFPPPPLEAPEEASRGLALPIAIAVGVALVAGAIAGTLILGAGEDGAPETATETSAETTTTDTTRAEASEPTGEEPPSNDGAEAPATPTAQVTLRSTPPGATVVVDGEAHGPTPLDLEWTGDDAARGRRVTLRFSLDGHRDVTVHRVLTGERLEVDVTLEPVTPAPRPVRRARPRPRPRPEPPAAPLDGYKLDPY